MKARPSPHQPIAAIAPVVRSEPRGRTSDRVFAALRDAITDCRIPPGASLSETDLARQLQVSRTPLREAITRLVDAGLVSVTPQVGTRVELIRLDDVEQARFARESLELAAFRHACAARPDASQLRALLRDQRAAARARDHERFFAADEGLHEEIFRLSGYHRAWTMMQPIKLQLDRLRRLSLPEPAVIKELIAEHTTIVDAIEAGRSRDATSVLRSHVNRVRSYGPELRTRHPEYFSQPEDRS